MPECIIFDIEIYLDLIASIAHTDLIQKNLAVTSTQARDYLPLLLLYKAKLLLNLAIKSPQYAFSWRQLHLSVWNVVISLSLTLFINDLELLSLL